MLPQCSSFRRSSARLAQGDQSARLVPERVARARCVSRDQLPELLKILRHGPPRILSRFVLEHHVALVADVTKQLDDPPEIGALLLPAGPELDLDLHDDGIWRKLCEFRVGIGAVEIAGVEVDAEPVLRDLANDRQQLIGSRHDAAVILEHQEDPAADGPNVSYRLRPLAACFGSSINASRHVARCP
jgi:hypothetical protein